MTASLARQSRRTPLAGSALVRLLAALDEVDAPVSKDAFAQRLSRWFDWTDAIALSAALDSPPARAPEAASGASVSARSDELEFSRVRATLAKLIAQDPAAMADPGRPGRLAVASGPPPDVSSDFSAHRERYVSSQRAMEARIGSLRLRVRATLALASPAMARLAVLDAAMEQVVGARERVLLSTVPGRLEQHFERLRQAAHETTIEPPVPEGARTRSQPGEWLDRFRRVMRDLLLAELDFRLQPVEGMLEALRRSSRDCHE